MPRSAGVLGRFDLAAQDFLRAGHGGPLWSKEEEALLKSGSDGELVRRFGRSRMAIQCHRQTLGLVKYHFKWRPWTAKEVALLGALPDKEVAQRLGRTISAVKGRRGILAILPFSRRGARPGL